MSPERNVAPSRLPADLATRLGRLLGGDAAVEQDVLVFIGARYQAESLFYIPSAVAREILKRPADFIRAARRFCQPELL